MVPSFSRLAVCRSVTSFPRFLEPIKIQELPENQKFEKNFQISASIRRAGGLVIDFMFS
jgi:hypothetical protein